MTISSVLNVQTSFKRNWRTNTLQAIGLTCLGGAVVRCRTRDPKVAGSNPGRGAIKSTIGQLSLPSVRGR